MTKRKDQQVETEDTFGSTFGLFFSETEETGGTGSVIRADDGILGDVVVDEVEAARFAAQRRAEADAHNAEVQARHDADAWEEE